MSIRRPATSRRRSAAAAIVEAVERRAMLSSVVVTTLADAGAGSLRQAIADAHAGDTVDLTKLRGTITLAGPLVISQDVTIDGPGAKLLTISGGANATSAFEARFDTDLSIDGVTIDHAGTANGDGAIAVRGIDGLPSSLTLTGVVVTNGRAQLGGAGVYATKARVTIRDSFFADNLVGGTVPNAVSGGAVWAENVRGLIVERSTFARNIAKVETSISGNYMASGGGISATTGSALATMRIADSTFDANEATSILNNPSSPYSTPGAAGGGANLQGNDTITIVNSTFVRNVAHSSKVGQGVEGGLEVVVSWAERSLVMTNNLIAGNVADNAHDLHAVSTSPQFTNNLIGIGGYSATNGVNGNLVGTTGTPLDAKVGALADNGGPVPTVSLLAGSPAIDAGVAGSAVSLLDGRGLPRVAGTDVGAFEFGSIDPNAPTIDVVVRGTAGADDVHVWRRLNGTQLRTVINGTTRNYEARKVRSISVDAGDGNDNVNVSGGALGVAVAGGSGDDTIVGGDGDDTLAGNGGHDVIRGGGGADRLSGNGGNDRLDGQAGDDRLYGGDGNDALVGGGGRDRLYGQANRDSYYVAGDGAIDRVYGTALDGDRAKSDLNDVLSEVLTVIA